MVVRFRPSDERQRTLRCPEPACSWSKVLWEEEAHLSLRGHYGYWHPERRLPEKRESLAALQDR
ncbi:hypothetical protein PBI_SMARTIES_64 [Microbacterium phage Smarties]|uniref:Uncharacterized protein n=1 Tax=Microbacterium phage Ariadne TaxID=2656546 RepID=A0A649VAT0_9CAUD|nr:hypothetical protein QDA10_gp064 [Microbacterium phage Ariadne]QGJ89468.1 hypothetical protein PBI_ARIADNE_64 [Microbacterium phage Ariadne]QGJ91455.1 hypothetical protein PBI_SMARTIES_64 [Microbacterium phage Smarties]